MPRILAAGHVKLTFLTTPPANPAAPTLAELEAGIEASCKVAVGTKWSLVDSDTIDDQELCSTSKAQAPGAANADLSLLVYRYMLASGGADPDADVLFEALRAGPNTTLWGYCRFTDKMALEPWAVGDPIYLGAEVWPDWPQLPDDFAGWMKLTVPLRANRLYPNIKVAS